MKITSVLGHDHTPAGKWSVLYCGHKLPGVLPYGPDIACHACDPGTYPEAQCPSCGHWEEDLDGFGLLACSACAWCSHPSSTGGACDVCGGGA